MIKRTLYFGNPAYLSLTNSQLTVRLPDPTGSRACGRPRGGLSPPRLVARHPDRRETPGWRPVRWGTVWIGGRSPRWQTERTGVLVFGGASRQRSASWRAC